MYINGITLKMSELHWAHFGFIYLLSFSKTTKRLLSELLNLSCERRMILFINFSKLPVQAAKLLLLVSVWYWFDSDLPFFDWGEIDLRIDMRWVFS